MDIRIPDIGDFAAVPVIEVHVAPGDTVAAEDPLITLESDKATMDIPAPVAGTVTAVRVSAGERVSAGHLIADLRTGETTVPEAAPGPAAAHAGAAGLPVTSPRRCSCSGPGRAGTRPRSARPTWARRWCSWTAADARRGLPQRRLHPVQGSPARRQGHRRNQGDERARSRLRRPGDRHRQAAGVEGQRGRTAHQRTGRPGPAAQDHHRPRLRPVHLTAPAASRARGGRNHRHRLRTGDHRRRRNR